MERPCINDRELSVPTACLEHKALCHLYDMACLDMPIFHPLISNLSHNLSAVVRLSKALSNILRSVRFVTRENFTADLLLSALEERKSSIAA
jgi:hypothetical protein